MYDTIDDLDFMDLPFAEDEEVYEEANVFEYTQEERDDWMTRALEMEKKYK